MINYRIELPPNRSKERAEGESMVCHEGAVGER
jgi:hypothetical protein